jgi:hypothetical protein
VLQHSDEPSLVWFSSVDEVLGEGLPDRNCVGILSSSSSPVSAAQSPSRVY